MDFTKLVERAVQASRLPYRATFSGRVGQYDPKYFKIMEDALRDEAGNVVGVKDKLMLQPPHSWEFPATADPGLAYRGMSFEEMRDILNTGRIRSRGEYNFSNQQGLTYFSDSPRQAASYAHSFAPNQYKATFDRPAFVLGVERPPSSSIVRIPGTDPSELGVRGEIPTSAIRRAWRGNVGAHAPGMTADVIWEPRF